MAVLCVYCELSSRLCTAFHVIHPGVTQRVHAGDFLYLCCVSKDADLEMSFPHLLEFVSSLEQLTCA